MQNSLSSNAAKRLRIFTIAAAAAIISLSLFSFNVRSLTVDFLTQLGITRPEANTKIARSLLGGYLDIYGVKNAKNIALGNRTAVAKEILSYVKQYSNTEAFKKEYLEMKESHKPKQSKLETPEEMRNNSIETYRKSISEMEANAKKADPSTKTMLEQLIISSKTQLKDIENPKNPMMLNYAKNYPAMLKQTQEGYQQQLNEWEKKYPANQLLFVKGRLVRFLEETNDINFDAELTTNKYGKKIFTDPTYERKGHYWKMAFRAGKEVVEPAREFVQQWIKEIN